MSDWEVSIIVTIGRPDAGSWLGNRTLELSPSTHRDPFMGHCCTGSMRRELLPGSIRASYSDHSDGNQAIFDADENLARHRL